jgi:hypothetical protein
MPGIGDEIDGAIQHAPQPTLHSMLPLTTLLFIMTSYHVHIMQQYGMPEHLSTRPPCDRGAIYKPVCGRIYARKSYKFPGRFSSTSPPFLQFLPYCVLRTELEISLEEERVFLQQMAQSPTSLYLLAEVTDEIVGVLTFSGDVGLIVTQLLLAREILVFYWVAK